MNDVLPNKAEGRQIGIQIGIQCIKSVIKPHPFTSVDSRCGF